MARELAGGAVGTAGHGADALELVQVDSVPVDVGAIVDEGGLEIAVELHSDQRPKELALGNPEGACSESGSKLHAFGPMGLKELTTTKFIVQGNGQVRE